MAGNSGEPGRSVASRCLSVLDAFRPGDQALPLREIALRTGLPKATVHRFAQEFVASGALIDRGRGTYEISVRMFEIGALAARSQGLRWVAQPVMEDLHRATRHNVHLGVWDGTSVVVVARIAGRRSVPTPARSGERLPAHATSIGKVLLAHAPDDVRDAVLAQPLRRFTPRTITDPATLEQQLEAIRDAGFATAWQERSPGTASLAVPVLGVDNELVAGLSIVVPVDRMDLARFPPALRVAARTIARRWIRLEGG
ncbi:IclR family transcriptional regulator [Pseudonocardia nigra]|uniref:IclR family transcriptional regulator n=1 Tax=Pseudonocardia nigra TaxID=1921578 RepID=UPI001C5D0856|nr:IclR family transcriptional regulator [Pseudonocardia nigra]